MKHYNTKGRKFRARLDQARAEGCHTLHEIYESVIKDRGDGWSWPKPSKTTVYRWIRTLQSLGEDGGLDSRKEAAIRRESVAPETGGDTIKNFATANPITGYEVL
jgi:hypothetical protein